MTTLHPARTIPFRELVDALRSAREARLVSEQASPDGLRVICYTPSCVYDGQWNDVTLIARGLVLDVKNERVVATPFPKFFNAFERGETIPDLPFETFEKVDGSLIIIFWHAGEWKTTTKAAFGSTQAQWAAERLKSCDTPNANAAVLKPILPSEVRETVQLYLAGKLDQWFVKQDQTGVVFILNVTDPKEAGELLEKLPLGRAGLMEFQLIPLGPLRPLEVLLSKSTD